MHQPEQEMKINAEAFQITVEFHDLDEENRLDFGTVRVHDIEQQSFKCENKGLYDVKFKFVMKKQIYRENFTIIPETGVLAPDEVKTINVRF